MFYHSSFWHSSRTGSKNVQHDVRKLDLYGKDIMDNMTGLENNLPQSRHSALKPS